MLHARRQRWWVVIALLIFTFLALDSMVADSPTMDEQNHIARGLAFLRTGDPRLSVEHPPLINSLSALPLLAMPQISLPLDDPSWNRQPADVFWYRFAEKLIWEDNRDLNLQALFFLARLPIVFLTMFLALVGLRFGRALWGSLAGLLAFFLLLFDPNILAHGRYSTTDIGGTLFILLASFMLWRLWRRPSAARWLWAALAIGLAVGSKLTALIFVPIWIVLAILPLYDQTRSWLAAALKRLAQLVAAGLVALAVVWALYAFEWGPFQFLDPRLAALEGLAGPLPAFLAGLERVLLLNSGGRAAYLLGQFSVDGFWFYFPVAWVAKTHLILLLALPVAAAVLLWLRPTRRKALFLLLPAVLYFVVAMQSALNLGYRHLLPVVPFCVLLVSGLVGRPLLDHLARRGTGQAKVVDRLHRWAGAAVLGAGLLMVLTSLLIHPHYLSYFNPLFGGPRNGDRILLDSNLDWGQDLLRLQSWQEENGVDSMQLGWFGTADPGYYGLDYQPLPGFPRAEFMGQWTAPPFDTGAPPPGVYAISAGSLWELPLAEKNVYTWFRERAPDARVGYSIFIYDLR